MVCCFLEEDLTALKVRQRRPPLEWLQIGLQKDAEGKQSCSHESRQGELKKVVNEGMGQSEFCNSIAHG